jgi:phosphoglycerate dehydrogenase-like enzyme
VRSPRCVVLPEGHRPALEDAIRDGGGELAPTEDAEALIWADPKDPQTLGEVLEAHPGIRWVQLPFAGIESFVDVIDEGRTWTCGKGVYAEPVAEHALMLALAGMRGGARYARKTSWSEPYGRNLLNGRVTILGGGEITRSLVRLLHPFGVYLTVVRNRPEPIPGVAEVLPSSRVVEAVSRADLVVLALALTPETERIVDAEVLAAMPSHAWLVNVARGRHVDTDALVAALERGEIGGAGLDVTDPEPLPDGHPLWTLPNVLITPHVGNTPEMGIALLAARVRENVQRYAAGEELLGPVYLDLGY